MTNVHHNGPEHLAQTEVSETPPAPTPRPTERTTMTDRARTLASRAGHRLARAEHVVEAVVVLLSVGAGGVGLSLLWKPSLYQVPSLRVALDLFPAHVWGGFLLVLAGMTLVALRGDRTTIAATMGGQTVAWSLWGICLIVAVKTENGVPSGAIIYTVLSWVCFVLAAYYWQTRERTTPDAA